MFGVKTRIIKSLEKKFFSQLRSDTSIPQENGSVFDQFLLSWGIHRFQKKYSQNKGIGNLINECDPFVAHIWRKLIPFNPNNLGNWTIDDIHLYNIATEIESKFITQIMNLLNGDPNKLEGYMTAGGTEGNIFCAWIGRNKLLTSHPISELSLITTPLTHYSIIKAADLLNLDISQTSINDQYKIDVDSLEKDIQKLYKQGKRGFLVSLTCGYTDTSTSDDFVAVCKRLRSLKRQLKGSSFYCWIDASLLGFVLPFSEEDYSPFKDPLISAIVTDLHKFGGGAYPSGMVMYKKGLRKYIEKDIPYLYQKDNTLLGSRPGIPAMSLWYSLNLL